MFIKSSASERLLHLVFGIGKAVCELNKNQYEQCGLDIATRTLAITSGSGRPYDMNPVDRRMSDRSAQLFLFRPQMLASHSRTCRILFNRACKTRRLGSKAVQGYASALALRQPSFPVSPNNVEVLSTPRQFYATLIVSSLLCTVHVTSCCDRI